MTIHLTVRVCCQQKGLKEVFLKFNLVTKRPQRFPVLLQIAQHCCAFLKLSSETMLLLSISAFSGMIKQSKSMPFNRKVDLFSSYIF